MIGTSPANQKIECFWSHLLKDRPGWWRMFFKDLSNQDLLDAANPLIAECVRYYFMDILRQELHEVAILWNQHQLSPSRGSLLPHGRPDALYFVPELFNCISHKKPLGESELKEFEDPSFQQVASDNCEEFKEFAETVLVRNGQSIKPKNVKEGLEMYFFLLEEINKHL